ncbi:hypothetical protein TNCV_3896941 [Trichonephila clavipes]|nr:hypothetical protein TNCV_3896941 [Trichonephila clavipes]
MIKGKGQYQFALNPREPKRKETDSLGCISVSTEHNVTAFKPMVTLPGETPPDVLRLHPSATLSKGIVRQVVDWKERNIGSGVTQSIRAPCKVSFWTPRPNTYVASVCGRALSSIKMKSEPMAPRNRRTWGRSTSSQ